MAERRARQINNKLIQITIFYTVVFSLYNSSCFEKYLEHSRNWVMKRHNPKSLCILSCLFFVDLVPSAPLPVRRFQHGILYSLRPPRRSTFLFVLKIIFLFSLFVCFLFISLLLILLYFNDAFFIIIIII